MANIPNRLSSPVLILTRSGISLKALLTILAICMITLASAEKSVAEDLNGANKTITSNSGTEWTTAYTNSSATAANLIVQPTSDLGASTNFSGQLTGNLRLVVHLKTNQDNNSRFVLNNANNTFTGGLFIEQGTVRVDNYAYIGGASGSKQIDMQHGCLMTNQTFEGYTFNMTASTSSNNRGAVRLSGGTGVFAAKITGTGNFEVVNDGSMTLTNTENDYKGKTYIGNFQWRKNSNNDQNLAGTLNLGASGVLPDTTVVVFGSGYGGTNDSIKSITLDLKGYNETIAGIYSTNKNAVIKSTNAATLTLNMPSGSSESYAGKITDNVNLVISGSGTQTLSGANTYTGTTTISSGTLNLSDTGCTLGSGALTIESGGVLLLTNAYQGMKNVSALSGNGEIRAASGYNYLNVTSSEPQSYSGTINVPESYRIDIGYNDGSNHSTNISLPNATVSLNGSGSILGLIHGSGTEVTSFTIGTLNGVEGSVVRESGNANATDSFSTLIVGQGNLAGTIGNNTANQSKLALVKNTSGTLTLSGANTYPGGTTISEGTLKLSGAGTLGTGAVENNATLEFAHESNQTVSNKITGYGSVIKSGSGTLTLSGENTYTGETTVSGGTLLLPSTASLKTSQVTVTTGGTFQTGTDLEYIPVNLDGGTFVIGDTSASQTVNIGALTLNGGTICFDFNDCTVLDDGYNVDTDWLKVSSASLSSGVIDLSFHGSSAEDWWNVIKNNYSESGFEIITGQIPDSESFNSANVTVSVNGTPSSEWTLTAKSGGLFLFAANDEPGPSGNLWYDANTDDITADTWTIDGTSKVGAKFTEGGDAATFAGGVVLNSIGEFQVGTDKNLTLSEEVTGSGSLKKTGEGTLTLSQAPGYTGSTAVETGTLVLSAGGTLNNLSGAGTVDNSGKALTLNNTSNSEFSGVITDAGAVAKTGSGTLELSGNNTYTGATTVSAGELVFSGSVLPVSAMTATGGSLVLGTAGNTITAKRGASIIANGGAVRVDGDLVFEAPGSGFVACNGSWTGSGSITLDGGYIRVGTNFNTTTGINFNGGSILNNNNDAVLTSDLTITKDGSTMQAGWSKSLTLKGALKGSASLTVGSDSGWLIFSGNGSAYQGSLLVKGNMRVGVANTDSSDASQYIGGKAINLNGGTIQNNNNNITVTNDLNVMSETGFKTGWSKSITLTGNVTGSAKLKQVSDSGWLILKTHSDGNTFTGPFQTGWASTSSRGQTRLAAEQPLGANAGVLYNYGYLDMNGFSQKFKGVVDDGANNKKGRIYNTTSTKSVVTFDITSQNLSYAGTIESNVELIVNASGAGTQTFTNGGSSFTGNATINGGTIRMTGKGSSGNSPIGKVSDTRYVYVNSGGELVFGNQDVLANAHNYAPINFVVNGGKISNDGAFYNFLQNTTFKNGGQLYASDGSSTWKAYKLLNVTVARNDDDTAGAPVLFSSDPSKPDATIAFGDISSVIEAGNSVSIVNVAEITSANASVNDNVSDLVISSVIADPVYKTDGALKNATEIRKTGAGTMELTATNTYTGKTNVLAGALTLASTGSLVSDVTVAQGASFIDAAPTITSGVTLNGGALVIGDMTASAQIAIGDLTVDNGSIFFDFNDSASSADYDRLTVNAATFTTGTINIAFNNGDQTDWWNNNTDNGYVLINTSSLNANMDNIQLLVNSAASDYWYLDTVGTSIVLKNQAIEPPVTDLFYRANTAEALAEDKWTIDGTNKQGVKFTEGDNNSVTYEGGVEMNVNGSVEVSENRNLTLAGVVSGAGEVEKTGDGTLTLSGDNTYTGKTTVSEGTLALTGDAVKANSSIEIADDATLEYNVAANKTKQLTFTDDVTVSGSNAIKTGAGALKILSTDGQFEPDNFAVKEGELNFKGTYRGDLEVERGATLSPGNSVGDLTVYGDVTIDADATGLFEFSAYNEDPALQSYDTLTIGSDGSFVIDENSIIKLYFEGNDADLWAAEGAEYQLVSDEDFDSEVLPTLGNYQGMFDLLGKDDGLYLIGLGAGPIPPGPEPGSGVPEPSTWALLILGAAGLLFWRKRK